MTFGPYARTWLEQAEKRRGWKPSTRRTRRLQVGRLGEWFEAHALGAIKPRHVAEYVDERLTEGYMPATIGGDLDVFYEVMKAAKREELIDSNPVDGVERPKIQRRKWRILEPVEVARVRKAFTEQQPRVVFLTLVLTGIRRFELQGLRWRDIDLVENVLRVVDSKTEEGVRSIALSPGLAEELWQWRRETKFRGDDERVFCNQETGGEYRRGALRGGAPGRARRGRDHDYVRPFHDLRHTAITNDAAAGSSADRGHGEGRALVDGDDEALPAPRRGRLPRRGCGARTAAARGRTFYPPERIRADLRGPHPHSHALGDPADG